MGRQGPVPTEPVQLFMNHVTYEPNTGCWLWVGTTNNLGYGQFTQSLDGNRAIRHKTLAHRWLWEYLFGPIPKGLEPDHRCRLRSCVNPDHIDLVTHRENVCRGNAARLAEARNTGLNTALNTAPTSD